MRKKLIEGWTVEIKAAELKSDKRFVNAVLWNEETIFVEPRRNIQLSRLMLLALTNKLPETFDYVNEIGQIQPDTQLTALQMAICCQHNIVVTGLMFEQGKNTFRPELHVAIQCENLECVQKFSYQRERVDYKGRTSLIHAAKIQNIQLVHQFLDLGGRLDETFHSALDYVDKQQYELHKLLAFESHLRCSGSKQINHEFQLSASAFIKTKFTKTFEEEPVVDKIKENVNKQLELFKQENREFCKIIDDCNPILLEMSNISENWRESHIYMYQVDDILVSPMIYAILTNNIKAVLMLKEKFMCATVPKTGISNLLVALRLGHKDIALQLLLEKELQTDLFVTPFVGAIAGGLYLLSIQYFSNQREQKDKSGKDALHQAIVSGDDTAFNDLLFLAENPPQEAYTHLQCAAHYKRTRFLLKLIPIQAGICFKNQQTALCYATQVGYVQGVEILRYFEGGMQFSQRMLTATFYVIQAIYSDQVKQECIELLQKYEIGILNNDGITALTFAAVVGDPHVCKMLLYEAHCQSKISALDISIARGNQAVFNVLITQMGEIVNPLGNTFLDAMMQSYRWWPFPKELLQQQDYVRAFNYAEQVGFEEGMMKIGKILGFQGLRDSIVYEWEV